MEKPIAVIEFGSKKLKFVIGYEMDNTVQVIYAITKPYGHILQNGIFLDRETAVNAIKDIKVIRDYSVNLTSTINDALLVLPPYGLEVYHTIQTTNVGGEEGRVENHDIRNLYALIRNRFRTL